MRAIRCERFKLAWLKVLHLFGVIAWFAGLFYLPRLFVYHADADDELSRTRFVVMERRLLNIIMLPAALISIGFGFAIALVNPAAYFFEAWFLAKLALVLILLGFHLWCARTALAFAAGGTPYASRTFRIMNELPTIILLLVLIFAIIRPF